MDLGKVPPQDIEAEQAVIGSMLTDQDAVSSAIETLKPEDFYREDNKIIYEAILNIYNRAEPIDIITLKAELSSMNKLEAVGGLEYIAVLPDKVPTTANVDRYIKIVEEKAMLRNLIKTGSIFGMDLMFNKIPNELYPYDYETFNKSKSKFTVVATNCETGEAEYFQLKDMKKDIMYLQASCSIPMFANIVEVDGYKLVDGGVSDSIPIEYALKQGCNKNIVVLTRDRTYRKSKVKFMSAIKRKYKKYPKLVKSIENRHLNYNKSLDLIKSLEEKEEVFVIRPKSPVKVSQVEKNKDKLIALYNDGYNDAKDSYEKIIEFINK